MLVLDVLRREVVPELRTLQGREMDVNFKNLLQEIVRFLKGDLSWLTSLSTKQRFCWGILATCCSKMAVNKESLEWVHLYGSFITSLELGLVYRSYCTFKKLSSEERVIVADLPQDVQTHKSEDLQR